jgi:GlpG protein
VPALNWIAVKYFPLEQDLSALTQFLNERQIQHLITEDQGQQVLAVADPNIIPALQDFLGRVELQVTKNTAPSSVEMDSLALVKNIQSMPVVFILIVLSVVGTVLAETSLGNMWLHYFTFQDFTNRAYIPLQQSLSQGEVWRLLTPIFLHFGIIHLVFNMLWVWILGQRLEWFLGPWQFLLLVVVSGVIANLAQYWWTGVPNFGGMSGVLYAFVGFILVAQRLTPHPLLKVPGNILGFMLLWLVLCMTGVVDLFISGGIANANHLGGLVAGMICACFKRLISR